MLVFQIFNFLYVEMGGRYDSPVMKGGRFNGSSENKNAGLVTLSNQNTVTAEALSNTEIRTF